MVKTTKFDGHFDKKQGSRIVKNPVKWDGLPVA